MHSVFVGDRVDVPAKGITGALVADVDADDKQAFLLWDGAESWGWIAFGALHLSAG